MRTPAQALRDAIASGAVEAWNQGRVVQLATFSTNEWVDFDVKSDCLPEFTSTIWHWRPAPTKRRIPFTRATVPKGALWNLRGGGFWMVALCYKPEGLLFPHSEFATYRDLASSDYSTDGGATWQPGSLEVES